MVTLLKAAVTTLRIPIWQARNITTTSPKLIKESKYNAQTLLGVS